jgi:hypothetical protein
MINLLNLMTHFLLVNFVKLYFFWKKFGFKNALSIFEAPL